MSFYQQLQSATAADRATLFAAPIIAHALAGEVTRQHYLDFLARAFHHVKHTVPLLMACGARLSDQQEWLRTAIAHYIEEEIGHHEWILNDIAAAGGDSEAVRRSAPDRDTELMVAYAYDGVMRGNPVGLLGMVFVLEGTSTTLASDMATVLQKNLQLSSTAFSYLTSHGALDIEHMHHFERLVNQLDDNDDKACVIQRAKMFFYLYGNMFRGIYLGVQR